ncbi:DUF4136 domain-containing protein [Polaromonas sp. P2-4]|nr:DUF4136 domain-containing protein [Polaromonas sp. P2-4]
MFFSPRLCMALLLTALLGACASPITARVTRFNQWPADLTGSTFSFRTPVDTGRELEQATYEGHVQAALEKQGLKRAPAGQLGRIQAEVSATLRSKEKTYLQPIYQDNQVFLPPFRDASGRVFPGAWAADPFGPRYVGDRQVSYTVHTASLRLRLLDAQASPPGKPRTVFESRAVYEGGSDNLPAVVPYLVRAVFDDFPGQNGQVSTVKFDSETGALIKK